MFWHVGINARRMRKVGLFDAGAINFAATATEQPVSTMLQNLWTRLGTP